MMVSDEVVRDIVDRLKAEPIGWIVDENGPWHPRGGHRIPGGHRYDGGCEMCRTGDEDVALTVVVRRVLDIFSRPLGDS
jgi:hypothetical protein